MPPDHAAFSRGTLRAPWWHAVAQPGLCRCVVVVVVVVVVVLAVSVGACIWWQGRWVPVVGGWCWCGASGSDIGVYTYPWPACVCSVCVCSVCVCVHAPYQVFDPQGQVIDQVVPPSPR